jgi:hypothetical protein
MKNQSRPSRQEGFVNLGCLGYLIAIAMLWGGGQGVYTALKNRAPLEITVAEYLKTKPDAEWVVLQDAQLNLLEAARRERLGKITEVFIPVRAPDDAGKGAVHILMSTKNEDILTALHDMEKSGGSTKEALEAASRHADKLFMRRDVTGLIQFGIDSDTKTRNKLAGLQMNLAKDFVILEEGKAPEMGLSIGMLGLGVLVGFFMLRGAARNTSAQPPPPAPNLPPKV